MPRGYWHLFRPAPLNALSFIFNRAKHPDKDYDTQGVMSELINYNRSPEYVSEGFSTTVVEILEITGKSINTAV